MAKRSKKPKDEKTGVPEAQGSHRMAHKEVVGVPTEQPTPAEAAQDAAVGESLDARAVFAPDSVQAVEISGDRWLTCTTCGGLVLPGATCPTDGQVAPT